ncbi:hypothetical protein D5125_02660 [Magnetovirga frankeli]|uniref:hypothetical protein n=1 Tax=Magnetovirga frankeli TaxID=947516 RepID=UPI0012940DD1|nr:hypothetical protein D5125_02660 [gamma proteobacterium SS-5]
MQAYELTAHIDEQGNMHLPDDCRALYGKDARVILLLEDRNLKNQKTEKGLEQFAGALKNFPSFAGDPVEIQRKMRDEWR